MEFNLNDIIKTTKRNHTSNVLKDLKTIKKEIKNAAKQGSTSVLIDKELLLITNFDFYLDYFSQKGFETRITILNDLEIKWKLPIEPSTYHIILEIAEGSKPKIHALCNSEKEVDRLKSILVNNAIEECFSVDPEESGLNREIDYNIIKKQCENEFKIFKINDLNKLLKEEV